MADTIVNRHRSVLEQADLPRDSHVTFLQLVDEGEQADVLTLPAELALAMGDPDTVTITVEVGDHLNALPEGYEPDLGTATVEQLLNELHDRFASIGYGDGEVAVTTVLAEAPGEVLALRGDLP